MLNNIEPFSNSQTKFPSAFKNCIPRHMKTYGCICISPNSKFLIVRGAFGPFSKYSFPKGHMEPNENDLHCALRELYEETAVTPDVQYSFYTRLKYNNKKSNAGYFVFFLNNEPTPFPVDEAEIAEARWASLEEIEQLDSKMCNVDFNQFRRWIKNKVLLPNSNPIESDEHVD